MNFDEFKVKKIVEEVRKEQLISPKMPDESFINYAKEGMYNINEYVGCMLDYEKDLDARSLLKNYILYANHKKLAEFKELYTSDYVALQLKYNVDTSV